MLLLGLVMGGGFCNIMTSNEPEYQLTSRWPITVKAEKTYEESVSKSVPRIPPMSCIPCFWVCKSDLCFTQMLHFHTVSIGAQERKQMEQNPSNHKLIHYCNTIRCVKCLISYVSKDGQCQQPFLKGTPTRSLVPEPLNWTMTTSRQLSISHLYFPFETIQQLCSKSHVVCGASNHICSVISAVEAICGGTASVTGFKATLHKSTLPPQQHIWWN